MIIIIILIDYQNYDKYHNYHLVVNWEERPNVEVPLDQAMGPAQSVIMFIIMRWDDDDGGDGSDDDIHHHHHHLVGVFICDAEIVVYQSVAHRFPLICS